MRAKQTPAACETQRPRTLSLKKLPVLFILVMSWTFKVCPPLEPVSMKLDSHCNRLPVDLNFQLLVSMLDRFYQEAEVMP